jgi:translation initiation factor IF-1
MARAKECDSRLSLATLKIVGPGGPKEVPPAPGWKGLHCGWKVAGLGSNQQLEAGMSAEEPIELEGTISTVLPGTMFRVKLDNQHEILAHLSGKMRKHFVRLTVGDRVRLEMSPYDLSKGRITYRLR